jgi:hypothetical protein
MKIIILVIEVRFVEGKIITMLGTNPWCRSPIEKLMTHG